MYLYVDETENEEYFIVAGLLVNRNEDIQSAFNSFKKHVNNIPINPRDKSILFTEFKSTIVDRRYRRIKLWMINELEKVDYRLVYSCYTKNKMSFSQKQKESVYINCLEKIINDISSTINVIFDTFNKTDFEEKIISRISRLDNVSEIVSDDSQKECGLQFADNLCSIVRHYKCNKDTNNFYKKIENRSIEV